MDSFPRFIKGVTLDSPKQKLANHQGNLSYPILKSKKQSAGLTTQLEQTSIFLKIQFQ